MQIDRVNKHIFTMTKTVVPFLLMAFVADAAKLTVDFNADQIGRHSRAPLRCTFSEPMIRIGFPKNSVPQRLVVEPHISGEWSWESQSTLMFTPDSDWQEVNYYTVTIPAGTESTISRNRLKRSFTTRFSTGRFSATWGNPRELRSTVDSVKIGFSLAVHPDSLRKHLTGAPDSLSVVLSERRTFRLLPRRGWPAGRRVTLSIDRDLTPLGGNLPLDTVVSTSFMVSDTLTCLGLFRRDKKVSSLDTLFLEDDYVIRFNRPLHRDALPDYALVNGKPAEFSLSESEISINRHLSPGKPCILSFGAGLPSADSAFLFRDVRMVLIGDSNRIDPSLLPFKINDILVRYDEKDSIPVASILTKKPVRLRPSIKFEILYGKGPSSEAGEWSGHCYCFTPYGIDTLNRYGNHIYPENLPPDANCTLKVEAGYRMGRYQLKKDFVSFFRTGTRELPEFCSPLINRWSRYGSWIPCDKPYYLVLAERPSIPLERFGSPHVVTAMRTITKNEELVPCDSSPYFPHCWHFDTIPVGAPGNDWFDYVPLRLAPALSAQGRGTAEVQLSVNSGKFDTLGRFLVTDLGIQLMKYRLGTAVAVTSLTKRKPVAGAEVMLIGNENKVLAGGAADSSGLFRVSRPLNPYFVIAVVPGDTLVYKTEEPSFADTAVCGGTIITDRGLYRPGDTLFFKGIIRLLRDRWEPVVADSAVVRIAWEKAPPFIDTLPLSGCGFFSAAVSVPPEVSRQSYTITAGLLHASGNITGEFAVVEFRPAELTAVVGKCIASDDSVRFTVTAKWLHGGAAGGSPFKWNCRIRNTWPTWPGEMWFCDGYFTWKYFRWNLNKRAYIDTTATGSSHLDASGCAVISIARIAADSGMSYFFGATIEGSAVQSAKTPESEVTIPPGYKLYIGIPDTTAPHVGDTVPFILKTVREDGRDAGGMQLRIGIFRKQNVKKLTKNRHGLPAVLRDTVRTIVRTDYPVTDMRGMVGLSIAALPAGDYSVTATPQNSPVREQFTYDFTLAAPDTGVQLRVDENEDTEHGDPAPGFTITAIDPSITEVGRSVRFRLRAARDSCNVLLIVGRENLYEHRWISMAGRDTVVAFLLHDEYIPVVKIRASFFPPLLRTAKGAAAFEQPHPVAAVSINAPVSSESRRIPVRMTTDQCTYAPGDTVTVQVTIPQKFKSARALVMAVDEGILRIGHSSTPNINEAFTRDTNDVLNLVNECTIRHFYGPFDYDSCNALRLRPWHGEGGFGFGNDGYGFGYGGLGTGGIDDGIDLSGGEIVSIIRNPPRPCAYFNPDVTFDADGKATCRFKLPGNLTRWRVTAVVDDTTSFGEDTASFESNKPLMVRPQLPRFLRVGDSASAVYIVENRSKEPRNIASVAMARSDTTVDSFTLGPDEIRQCRFPLIGRAAGVDSVLFIARSDTLGDGTIQAIPTIFERHRDVAAIGGSTIDSACIPLLLPKPSSIDSGNLTLSLSTTRMQNLAEGARYLFDYPYGCLEQQSSRIMPLLVMGDFTQRFNLPMLSRGDEKKVIQTYLDNIGDFQNRVDGGLCYWPSDSGSSSPWLTTFVLETIIKAKAAGYAISDTVYSRALGYLKREMLHTDNDGRKQFIDSYTLLVMAKAGKPDRPALRRLFKDLKTLPYPARINLLKAMHTAGGFKRKVAALQKNLRRGLVEKDRLAYVAPEAAQGFEFCHESPVRLTALTLEALLETGSKNRFDEPMIRWLTEQRRNGRWRTTQENQAVFRAFAAYTEAYEHDSPKLSAAVKLAGKSWFSAALEGREGAISRASRSLDSIGVNGETSIDISRSGSGRLYWDVLINTFHAGDASAVSSGLSISRTVTLISGDTSTQFDPSRPNVGQLLCVTGTIRCNQDITFAAISDPVPAGCEAVNPELNSGEQDIAEKITTWNGPSGLSHREFRDSRVLFFADDMPAGEYRFSYLLKVTTAGKFSWLAPFVEAMYYPEIYGRGEEGRVVVGEGR